MSKEKQIEELWEIITTDCDRDCDGCELENEEWCFSRRVANDIYNAGYRKQEWISVEERLPEKSRSYLVYTYMGNICVLPYSQKYKLFNAFDSISKKWNNTHAIPVTHWMPLPEAPKMKGD